MGPCVCKPQKPPSFFMRYIGVAFIVALLAIVSVKARAGEPDQTCMDVMAPEAGAVTLRHRAGVPDAINRWLIRSEPRYGEQGRWLLLRFLDALEQETGALPVDILGALCAIPNMPAAAPLYRSEFDKPKDI